MGPRAEGYLRSRIFWSLVAFAAAPLTITVLLSTDPWVIAAALVGLLAAFVCSVLVTSALMTPVLTLQRRLRIKNYGDAVSLLPSEPLGDALWSGDAPEVATKLLDLWANMTQRSIDASTTRLPSELAEIEKLARAGRMSNLALESVKKDLFRHLSHQLKSPMALLRAHAQAARKRFTEGDFDSAYAALSKIEDIAMNVAGLVEQLLSIAWVESIEDRGLDRSKVNLSSVLMQVLRFRRLIAEEKSIELVGDVDAGIWVIGEQHLLHEMFASLIDNAIRYSPRGTTVRLEGRTVPSTRSVLVTVTDEGPGIPPSEREHVFEPFYGGIGTDCDGNTTYGTRRHRVLPDGIMRSSHGLGLSLVRSVARLHGASATLSAGSRGAGLRASVVMAICTEPEMMTEPHE